MNHNRTSEMNIYNIKDKKLPLNRRILVYAYNTDDPGWYIDKYTISDNKQLNGWFYPHNISHWCELPNDPTI